MAIYKRFVSFDEVFKKVEFPIILNDQYNLDDYSKKQLLLTTYDSDTIDMVVSCKCTDINTRIVGRFREGEYCPICKTYAASPIPSKLEPITWFRRPEGVSKLINPDFWLLLKIRFSTTTFNPILWICNTRYKVQPNHIKEVLRLEEAGIKRGYNYFVENIELILNILTALKKKSFNAAEDQSDILDIYHAYKNEIFSDYFPFANMSLFISEKTDMGIYFDKKVTPIIDAAMLATLIDDPGLSYNTTTKQNKTTIIIDKIAEYYDEYYSVIGKKTSGVFRKHIYASRAFFGFRAVITGIQEIHNYDEIHIPWGAAVVCLRYHILNKLMKKGVTVNGVYYKLTHNQAISLIYDHIEKYNELIDQALKEIIAEAPNGRLVAIMQRNPSLLYGSMQRVFIPKVKINPKDKTISMSDLITAAFNADYDGDQLNVQLALDVKTQEQWERLAPHNNIFQLTRPGEISGNLRLPKTTIDTMSEWLSDDIPVDPIKLQRMNELLVFE